MKTSVIAAAILCSAGLLATAPAARAAGVNVNPGKWDTTIETDISGQLPGKDKATHTTKCIKPEDVKEPEAVAQAQQKDKRCTSTVVSATRDHVAWTYQCPNGSGTGDFVYAGDSYEATFESTAHRGDRDIKTTTHLKAKRIGDC
jgi:hypothetical protein